MRHINIPVFIPHLGCPHTCAFCNQRKISGVSEFDIREVKNKIDIMLSEAEKLSGERHIEIAFFGGSFTGIPHGQMISLLELVKPYIDSGRVTSLRCSTRPDYIDEDIIQILKDHRMTTVELGIQSMSDKVLSLSERGHTAEQSMRSSFLIKESGMKLVGQMMTGLPGSERADELYTAEMLCKAGVDAVRIYPTMVFADTGLEKMMKNGCYIPPCAEETVSRVADLLEIFDKSSVPVIRIGLCAGEDLYGDSGIIAGQYEPALGEIAKSEVFFRRIMSELSPILSRIVTAQQLRINVRCPIGATSAVCGHRRINRDRIEKMRGIASFSVAEDPTLVGYEIKVFAEEITENNTKHK